MIHSHKENSCNFSITPLIEQIWIIRVVWKFPNWLHITRKETVSTTYKENLALSLFLDSAIYHARRQIGWLAIICNNYFVTGFKPDRHLDDRLRIGKRSFKKVQYHDQVDFNLLSGKVKFTKVKTCWHEKLLINEVINKDNFLFNSLRRLCLI